MSRLTDAAVIVVGNVRGLIMTRHS